jgi:hypothetical protein
MRVSALRPFGYLHFRLPGCLLSGIRNSEGAPLGLPDF